MAIRAIFLDKNGTLVDTVPFNVEPRGIMLASGAGPALRLLSRLDYRFYVLSNHDGIAQGKFGEASMERVRDRLTDLLFRENLSLDGFYFCPHRPDGAVPHYAAACDCRKPKPGMLLQAAHEHDIDLAESWMIGDILHDVEAGNRAGCHSVLIDNGNETEWRLGPNRIPTRIAPDLYSAAVLIASHTSPK